MFEGLLQPTHLVLILAIVLIVFGPGKLPGLGKAIGESMRELRKGASELTEATTGTANTSNAASTASLAAIERTAIEPVLTQQP